MSQYLEEGEYDWDEEAAEETPPGLFRSSVVETNTEVQAPEFCSWTSFNVPLFPAYVQVLQRRYHRYKAKFAVTVPATTILLISNDQSKLNSATSFQLVAGQTLPDYDAQQPVYMSFTGTGPVVVSVMDEAYGLVQ